MKEGSLCVCKWKCGCGENQVVTVADECPCCVWSWYPVRWWWSQAGLYWACVSRWEGGNVCLYV